MEHSMRKTNPGQYLTWDVLRAACPPPPKFNVGAATERQPKDEVEPVAINIEFGGRGGGAELYRPRRSQVKYLLTKYSLYFYALDARGARLPSGNLYRCLLQMAFSKSLNV